MALSPGQQRRRGASTGAATRVQLVLIALLGAFNLSWLYLIVKYTDPDTVLNRVWFVLALSLSIFPTASLVVYAIRSPRATGRAVRSCLSDSLREGLLLSAVVAANAILRMTSFWSVWTASLLIGIASMADLIALSRRWALPIDRQ